MGIVGVVILVYLVVNNNQLKKDVNRANAEADELNEYLSETDKQTINFEANKPAEQFILGYFDFEEHPKEEDVEGLVTDNAAEQLSFGEMSQSAGEDEVISEVEELDVYYGDATDNRQELFARFNNVITYNDVTSEKMSYIHLDMVKENDEWKVDDFEFEQ